MNSTNKIWYVVNRSTGRPVSQLPMSINAANFHLKENGNYRLDTINGGGSEQWLDYPNDDITELTRKLIRLN